MAAVPSIGRPELLELPSASPEAYAHDLFERHARRIELFCWHVLGSREEAEDAVQTTFMNALGALRKGIAPESEVAWLLKIAENVCLTRRRSSQRRGRVESPADFAVIQEVVAGPDRPRDELIGIEDALLALPSQQRRAILLREWQGLSYREIASELGVTQSAVETLIFRGRRSLAHRLANPATPPPRRRLRRVLHLGDAATIFVGAKAFFGGTAAVKAAVATAAVVAMAGASAERLPRIVESSQSPLASSASAVVHKAALPAEAAAPARSAVAAAAARRSQAKGKSRTSATPPRSATAKPAKPTPGKAGAAQKARALPEHGRPAAPERSAKPRRTKPSSARAAVRSAVGEPMAELSRTSTSAAPATSGGGRGPTVGARPASAAKPVLTAKQERTIAKPGAGAGELERAKKGRGLEKPSVPELEPALP